MSRPLEVRRGVWKKCINFYPFLLKKRYILALNTISINNMTVRYMSMLKPQEQSPTTPSTAFIYVSPQIICPIVVETIWLKRSAIQITKATVMIINPVFSFCSALIKYTLFLKFYLCQLHKKIHTRYGRIIGSHNIYYACLRIDGHVRLET